MKVDFNNYYSIYKGKIKLDFVMKIVYYCDLCGNLWKADTYFRGYSNVKCL